VVSNDRRVPRSADASPAAEGGPVAAEKAARRGGLLPHVRITCRVQHWAPVDAAPAAVLDEVARELHRQRNIVHVVAADRLEFEAPGPRASGFGEWQSSSVVVSGGAVTLMANRRVRDPIRLELWLNPWLTYVIPCLAMCGLLVWDFLTVQLRAALLGFICVGALVNTMMGVEVYRRWVMDAAKRV
jgi:hypothetical protein